MLLDGKTVRVPVLQMNYPSEVVADQARHHQSG